MLDKTLRWLLAHFGSPMPKPLPQPEIVDDTPPLTMSKKDKHIATQKAKDLYQTGMQRERKRLDEFLGSITGLPDDKHFARQVTTVTDGKETLTFTCDSAEVKNVLDSLQPIPIKAGWQQQGYTGASVTQLSWFAAQGFIGYQTCAIIAQHWLVSLGCSMPGVDALRNGYEITANEGEGIDIKVFERMKELDAEFKLSHNLKRAHYFNAVFGIRIIMFDIDVADKASYYSKPFNIDGIKPKSYRGIIQIDPYWMAPELNLESASQPASLDFYEPTWWRVGNIRIHRSHLIILRGDEVADILKPTYLYGGIPLTQKAYERVYSAERCANEGPPLLLTKRKNVYHTDLEAMAADPGTFEANVAQQVAFRDNYGVQVAGLDEKIEQFDTALADVDSVTLTQYQLVASIFKIPVTELLRTTPKGFNATGEFEEKSYRKELETIQTDEYNPVVERHHQILIRSHICPEFNIKPFKVIVKWEKTNTTSEKEQKELNKLQAETDAIYIDKGVIDGEDVRDRIIADPKSGYSTLDKDKVIEQELPDEDFDLGKLAGNEGGEFGNGAKNFDI